MFLLNSAPTEHKVRLGLPFVSPIFLVFFIVSLRSSEATHGHSPTTSKHFGGIIDGDKYGVVSGGIRTRLLDKEGNAIGIALDSTLMLLAENRTHRRDPLDGFNYYRGGWNITNKHYFSSVGFTAAPLLVVALLWFLGFCLYLLVSCFRPCCCRKWNYDCPQAVCAFSLVFLVFCTIIATVGCIVLYTGQAKFDRSTKSTLTYIVDQVNVTVETLRNFSDSMASAKGIGVGQFSLPSNVQANIDRVVEETNSTAGTLEAETDKNHDRIRHALNSARLALIVTAAVMLFLALVGFLFSCLGLRLLVQILKVIGWVLVTVALVLSALLFVVHNVIGDSCVALNEWARHPAAHTALDDIIPCVDSATAQDALNQGKDVTVQLIGIVNTFITNVSNANIPHRAGPAYYNQSGPLVPVLCNPYNSDKTGHQYHCSAAEVTLGNAANEWSKYICEVSSSGSCTTVGRLTPTYYKQMVAVASVSRAIYQYGPFLVELGDCTFLWKTFSKLYDDDCPRLRRYSKLICAGLLMASVSVMLSVTLWVSCAGQRQHQEVGKESMPTSSQQFPLVRRSDLSNQELKMSAD